MGVKVIWDDEAKTIIRQIYTGNTIVEDYYQAVDAFAVLANSVDYTVHSIMDRTRVTSAPATMLQVLRYGNQKMPDNVALRVIVRPAMMTKIFVDMGKRIAPNLTKNVHFVDTLDEAYTVIAAYQLTNPAGESVE